MIVHMTVSKVSCGFEAVYFIAKTFFRAKDNGRMEV